MTECTDWFKDWFNTSYYHILYHKRDDMEAAHFIDHLLDYLKPAEGASFLDLACGKGRHSIYLHQKGYAVTGMDLSPNNIAIASESAGNGLSFLVHDMREPKSGLSFDFILNLFTSFGYFKDPAEDLQALRNAASWLPAGGIMVLDYFNALKPNFQFGQPFTKELEGIRFDIIKEVNDQVITKRIDVTDGDTTYYFEEHVRLITQDQFKQLFRDAGFMLVEEFGDYQLHPFDPMTSDRLILIAKKI